jgi:glycosyltransferase involved in cell wall biosynthesis
MKILLVSEDLPAKMVGGLGKHVVTLGNALIATGHDVALMGHNALSYEECAAEIGFNGNFIAGFDNPIRGWKERQLGFFNPFKRPVFAQRLAAAILAHAKDFDVVHYHGHLPMAGRYIPRPINFVQTRHDQGGDCIINVRFKNGDVCRERAPHACAGCIHPGPGPFRTKLSALAVKRYRAGTVEAYNRHPVIFVSEFLRRNFLKTMPGARMDQSTVIHNFLDESLLSIQEDVTTGQMDPGEIHVHVTGRLDEPKSISAFLDLLAPQMPPRWRVDVYGDGPQFAAIKTKHANLNLRMHGHRLNVEILRATKAASVVVMPSVCEEAFGMVTLEALRLGKVCYALNRGGTPELARYGVPGQLRLFDDLPALVTALIGERDFAIGKGGDSTSVETHLEEVLAVYARYLHKDTK